MRSKLCCAMITIFPLLLFSPAPTTTCASPSKDNYLWIEFSKQIKEKDGSVTQPLFIYYGIFPDQKKGTWELDGFRAFYTLNEKDEKGNRIFYEAEIERDKGKSLLRIKAFHTDRCIVLVQGRKKQGKATRCYSAKTSFVLFGHSPSKRKKIKPVASSEINRQFAISITPQFHYWPQTSNPVKIALSFNEEHLGGKILSIFDENQGVIDLKTDETGNYTYTSPNDKKLNREGETAFKQTVVVAEETEGNTNYISSYTLLLHRNRFKNRKVLPGISIFGGTMVGVFLLVVVKRKRFKI